MEFFSSENLNNHDLGMESGTRKGPAVVLSVSVPCPSFVQRGGHGYERICTGGVGRHPASRCVVEPSGDQKTDAAPARGDAALHREAQEGAMVIASEYQKRRLGGLLKRGAAWIEGRVSGGPDAAPLANR